MGLGLILLLYRKWNILDKRIKGGFYGPLINPSKLPEMKYFVIKVGE